MILLVEILLQLILGELNKLTTMLDIGAIIYARFICATILHLTLIEELHSALNNMKYVLNHQYIFEQPKVAFMVTFLHFVCTFMTETTNIFVILTSLYPLDIVLNFIAIAIIADFDNYVYASMRNENCKKLVEYKIAEKVLIIHHTTSKRCGVDELSDVKDENGDYRKLKITFSDRTCAQKFSYSVYKGCRLFYVSFYFYFYPFTAVIFSIIIPLYYQAGHNNIPVTIEYEL
jgi:hypothetical protein